MRRGSLRVVILPMGDLLLVVFVFLLGYWLRHFALAGTLDSLFGMPGDFRLNVWHYIISGTVSLRL